MPEFGSFGPEQRVDTVLRSRREAPGGEPGLPIRCEEKEKPSRGSESLDPPTLSQSTNDATRGSRRG
jgi:hypothetical protein